MTISVRGGKWKLTLWVPLSAGIVKFGLRIARKRHSDLPPVEGIVPILKALKARKRKYGKLTLVEMKTADGESVKIVL